MAKRKRYTDEFRASAVLMLQAAGYPDQLGALSRVAANVNVPARTLSRWFNAENNPPPDKVVSEKRIDFVAAIEQELAGIFNDMPSARHDASYRDMATAAGILLDKKQLLTGQPTAHNKLSGKGPGGSIPVMFTPFEDMSDDELDKFISEND